MIVEVKGNTYCIDTRMTYIPFYKINDNEIIMLDSGWAKGERKGIKEVLENNKFKVVAIINSHFHIDHAGNNAYINEKHQKEISVCGVNFKILYTPGHSPAHICIMTPDDVFYVGDTLISYEVMKGSKLP